MRGRGWWSATGVLLLATACGAAPPAVPVPADVARLAVAPEGPTSGYSRRAFGAPWADVDGNGCGTRDDVLRRDLTAVRTRGRCVVVAGVLADPYTGRRIAFMKARADEVQVDHVVSLAEAWRSGAAAWPARRRVEYANDPVVLLATSGAVNAGKGDQDPGTWSPATRAGTCTYARRVVAIKLRWALSVDPRERAALVQDLGLCRP